MIRTRTCAYQGVRNLRFSENLACFLFLKHPFWDSNFWLITDDKRTWKNHNFMISDFFLQNVNAAEWITAQVLKQATSSSCHTRLVGSREINLVCPIHNFLHLKLSWQPKQSSLFSFCTKIQNVSCIHGIEKNIPWYNST